LGGGGGGKTCISRGMGGECCYSKRPFLTGQPKRRPKGENLREWGLKKKLKAILPTHEGEEGFEGGPLAKQNIQATWGKRGMKEKERVRRTQLKQEKGVGERLEKGRKKGHPNMLAKKSMGVLGLGRKAGLSKECKVRISV